MSFTYTKWIWLSTLLILGIANAQEIIWRPAIPITSPPGASTSPEMVSNGGSLLHIVYYEDLPGIPDQVYYIRSANGGLNFSHGNRLNADSCGIAQRPSVAACGSLVYAVYEQHHSSGALVDIAFRRSLDGGLNWESQRSLSHNAITPRIACQGDSVYVIYNTRQTPYQTLFRYSYNRGRTWSQEIVLTPYCTYPDLAACDGKVFIAYELEYGVTTIEIYLRRSLNGGQTWEASQQISQSPGEHSQWAHLSVQSGGLVGVTWFDYENSPMPWTGWIYCRLSNNYGQTFNPIQVVSSTYYCTYNDIAIADGVVHVSYSDQRWGEDHAGMYYRCGPHAGQIWLPGQPLLADSSRNQESSLAAGSGRVYAVWDNYSDGRLYFRAGFGSPGMVDEQAAISNSGFQSSSPSLSLWPNPANGAVHLSYDVPLAELPATLQVYNSAGQMLRQWQFSNSRSGVLQWDNPSAASGAYFIVLKQGHFQEVRKLTLIK
jgi:hypothetical protein